MLLGSRHVALILLMQSVASNLDIAQSFSNRTGLMHCMMCSVLVQHLQVTWRGSHSAPSAVGDHVKSANVPQQTAIHCKPSTAVSPESTC